VTSLPLTTTSRPSLGGENQIAKISAFSIKIKSSKKGGGAEA
jgi:hypothetical protein